MLKRELLRKDQQDLIDALKGGSRLAVLTMGGGKTAASLTAYRDLREAGVLSGGIVVAPPLVAATVWPAEPAKWEHLQDVDVEPLEGGPAKRLKQIASSSADLIVVPSTLVQWLVKEWRAVPDRFKGVLIVDETSAFRNGKSKRGRALRQIAPNFGRVWGATGTPRPRGHIDLWGQLSIISQGRLWGQSYWRWLESYFWRKPWGSPYEWHVQPGRERELDEQAAPWIIVPVGSDRGVPDLRQGDGYDVRVPLPKDAAKAYAELERDLAVVLASGDLITSEMAVSLSGKLSQIAAGGVYDDDRNAAVLGSHKYDRLAEMLAEAGENIVVCYEYQWQIPRLQAVLREACGPGAGFARLGGVAPAEARKAIADWNAGKVRLLALSPAAASHGLELQHGGRRMVWLSPPWSSEAYQQTVARLHRSGQQDTVFVHRMVAEGTIDELRLARCEGRAEDEARWIEDIMARHS